MALLRWLSEAAASGSAEIIEQLLTAGADPNTRTTADGETVLMTAAHAGNVDAVRILLGHGADVNAKEAYRSQTALHQVHRIVMQGPSRGEGEPSPTFVYGFN